MKCFKLAEKSKSEIVSHIDVSGLDTAELFDNPEKVKTVAFNATIPDLNWEPIIQEIMKKSTKDIFMYVCIDLVPGDSKSSVITEDCILVEYDTRQFFTLPEDKSMPLLTCGNTVYRLCFHGETAIRGVKSGKIYCNDNGKLTEGTDTYPKKTEEPVGKYGVELSF